MALIKCPKCGKEISDRAVKCVRCGWKVNLNELNVIRDEPVSYNESSKIDTVRFEDERKKMLKETELEIENMKNNARKEIEVMNESAKRMVIQRQRELELEYQMREKELIKKKEFLDKTQRELEQSKKENISGLQCAVTDEKKTNSLNINIIFMLIITVIIICFMIIVMGRLNRFSSKMEDLVSIIQKGYEVQAKDTQNIPAEKTDNVVERGVQEDENNTGDVLEQSTIESANTDSNAEIVDGGENDAQIDVTYDACKASKYPKLIFTIKNISNEDITVKVNNFQYINDISVSSFGITEYNTNIPAGKATVVKYTFDRDDVSFSKINKIEFVCRSYDSAGNETENSFIFDNLNVKIR